MRLIGISARLTPVHSLSRSGGFLAPATLLGIPKEFAYIDNNSRSTKFWDLYGEDVKINAFVAWLEENYTIGIHGDPCNWKEYNLPKMDIYEDEEDK